VLDKEVMFHVATSIRASRATLRSRPTAGIRRFVITAAISGLATVLILGCGKSDAEPVPAPASPEATPGSTTTVSESPTCDEVEGGKSELPATYRTKGKELVGDVDGDGREDQVSLRVNERRPAHCRYLLVVEISAGTAIIAPVAPLSWPGTDPDLLLLAEVDGRSGVEPVIALSPAAVYRPGAVFTMRDGELRRMRLIGIAAGDLFPFYDEFPAGVDCAPEPGAIVVTFGHLADRGEDDRHWDITRSVYRAAGSRFEPVRDEEFRVEVGPEAERRWPEIRGDPFLSCADRVD
jgi:hypothetical protein